jgi:gamma-glutamyltranspeptidase/glutathione hydrolase
VTAALAAGHPATTDAGFEVLEAGGSAADAAVAAGLASCVAETVMTGLLGGGYAVWYEAGAGAAQVEALDCFCAVPGLGVPRPGADVIRLEVPFGEELVHYAVGPATFAVPGLPAGLHELWARHGRLPWARLVQPALRLARRGVRMPPAHAACLRMLEPVMTMNDGAPIYAPGGRLLAADDELRQPGLVRALELVEAEGARTFYEGTIAERLLELCERLGGLVTRDDLETYAVETGAAATARWAPARVLGRGDALRSPLDALGRLPRLRDAAPADRAVALAAALGAGGPGPESHTTNITVVDGDGNACVLTSSLGLGSGDWVPGLDLHLNSMLGEADLLVGELVPGRRMQSMMCPLVAVGAADATLLLAGGAAGGTRLGAALVQVVAGVLDEGLDPRTAVERPRLHVVDRLVHAEPGVGEEALSALERAGYTVRRWPERHHFFGGVSAVTPSGAAGDPRRSGSARSRR